MKITKKLIAIVVALLLVSPWFVMLHGVATTDIVETTTEPITTVIHTTAIPTTETTTKATTEKVTTTKVTTTKPVTTTVETTEAEETYTTTFLVTAYCACYECCGKTDGITASGTVATQGRTIAVDPDYYPYGTEIILNGNTYVAEDCGGAISGNDIDMYFDNHQDALEWGIRYVEGVVVW